MNELKKKALNDVAEWNRVFDLPPSKDVAMRMAIVNEEILETVRADNDADLIDGLCDTLWVLYGTVLDFDLYVANYEGASVLPGILRGRAQRMAGVMASHSLILSGDSPYEAGDLAFEAIELVVSELVGEFGLPASKEAWNEVRVANFSKLWREDELGTVSQTGWSKRDSGLFHDDGSKLYVVRDNHRKIRKPPHWQGPDHARALELAAVHRSGKEALAQLSKDQTQTRGSNAKEPECCELPTPRN